MRSQLLIAVVLVAMAATAQQPRLCDTTAAPCSPKDKNCQSSRNGRLLHLDGGPTYFDWLNQDVRWIITNEERAAFKKLTSDEERNQFVEQFWLRRDPTPDTIENEFKEEHYRRMVYANEHFGSNTPGSQTDRGRIYILFGPPDSIAVGTTTIGETNPVTVRTERWSYTSIKNFQPHPEFQFVDSPQNGDLRLVSSPELEAKIKSFRDIANANFQQPGPQEWPEVRSKELMEIVSHKVTVNLLPYDVSYFSFRITDNTDWVPVTITIRAKDLTWSKDGDHQQEKVRVFGRFTTLTQRIAHTFEDEINLTEPASGSADKTYSYWKAIPLRSGLYRLDLAIQDVNGNRVGTWSHSVRVQGYDDFSHISSIVLSKTQSDPLFQATDEQDAFVSGDTVHLFAQLYKLGGDNNTGKPDAAIDYEVFRLDGKKPESVLHLSNSAADPNQRGEQITLNKELSVGSLNPGKYALVIRVRDNIARQDLCAEQPFTVN